MAPNKVLRAVLLGVFAVGMTVMAGSAAAAQANPDYTADPPPEVIETAAPPVAISQDAGPSELVRTGSNVTPMLVAGGGLVLVGGALILGRRHLTT